MLTWNEFEKVDMRIGTVIEADEFPEARKPALKLKIDLGDIGIKQSSAQITQRYHVANLIGRQVACVVNFAPMKIAGYTSEVLVLGGILNDSDVVLIRPDEEVGNGTRIC